MSSGRLGSNKQPTLSSEGVLGPAAGVRAAHAFTRWRMLTSMGRRTSESSSGETGSSSGADASSSPSVRVRLGVSAEVVERVVELAAGSARSKGGAVSAGELIGDRVVGGVSGGDSCMSVH